MIALAAALLAAAPPPLSLQPGAVVWRTADAELVVGSCAAWPEPGLDCKTLELHSRRQGAQLLGKGYTYVASLWSRPPGVKGPDIVAIGSGGGTNGCLDVFAASATAAGPRVQDLHPCHSDMPRVGVRDELAVTELRLDLGGLAFSGSNASTASIPVPVIWRSGGFTLDNAEIGRRSLGDEDASLRRAAVQVSLYEFKHRENGVGVAGDGAGLAVQALAGLMLDGRAAEARDLLHASWPWNGHGEREAGEGRFWGELCRGVLHHPLWRELDLARLPGADLIRSGAAGG